MDFPGSDGLTIGVITAEIMVTVAVVVGLVFVSLRLNTLVFGFVSVWWGELLGFLFTILIVIGVAGLVGTYLLGVTGSRD